MGRLLVIVLVLAMVLSTGATVAQAEAAGGSISLWHIQTEELIGSIIKDSISRFEEANPGFTVEETVMGNEDYKSKIMVAIGSNTAPDIFITWTGGGMIEYVNADRIIPLTKYFEQDNYKDYFMDAGIAQATYKDDIWAVPVENCSIAGIFYNKKAFETAGVAIPTTIAELEAACDKFIENGILPFALANKAKYVASFYYMYLVDRYAGPSTFAAAANRQDGVTFEDEAFLWAGNKITEWAEKGYFGEGYNSLDGESGMLNSTFYDGMAAMRLDGAWSISRFYADGMTADDIGMFPFPALEGGKGDINNLVGTVGDTFYCINKDTKFPDQAFDLIRYMIDDKAVAARVEAGRLPPTKNATAGDPLNGMVLDLLIKAPSIQLWYDQYLPSAMAEIHKDELQALIGLSITPEQYNATMEAAAQSFLKP